MTREEIKQTIIDKFSPYGNFETISDIIDAFNQDVKTSEELIIDAMVECYNKALSDAIKLIKIEPDYLIDIKLNQLRIK